MAYHMTHVGATFMPGGFDDYYEPPPAPELVAPAPQRLMPEMSDQIQGGLANMNLNNRDSLASTVTQLQQSATSQQSPFPKLHNPSANVPPSDAEFEATLETARVAVLASNDAEMQLAWAQDVLHQIAINMDCRERLQSMQVAVTISASEYQLKTDAMNIVTFLADQHHPRAEFMKGMWWEFGRFGLLLDKKEAFRCYSRAADKGYTRAEYRIGMLYEASNDPVKALKHYHRGVDMRDSACMYRLGMMTLRGQHGQPRDYSLGLTLIRQSAECADENAAQGAYVYGMLLARQLPQIELPDGVLAYDDQAARIEIEKAAYLKFPKAQLKMGSAYELGTLGCEFSPALSLHYFALAANQGEPDAEMGISKWFLVGHEGVFPKNEELAYAFALRAANSGLANAEFAIGYFNELGIYVQKNVDLAVEWYTKAAGNGNADAKSRIDGISRKQILSRRDHENVAITRIKSQYGSQQGPRPSRFQHQGSRLASVSDDPVEQRRAVSAGGPISNGQFRPSSTTPYPLDDRPPTVPPLADRPPSAAPYPLEDGPPRTARRQGSMDSFGMPNLAPHRPMPPDERPSSAFSFVADQRPASAATAATAPVVRQRYPSGPVSRPSTAMDPRGRMPQNMRHVSSPAGMTNRPLDTPPPMPVMSRPPTAIGPPNAQDSRLDIGFSAPIEPRRPRPPQQAPSNPNKPLPPTSGPPTPMGGRPLPQKKPSRPDMSGRVAAERIPTPSSMPSGPSSSPATPAPAMKPSAKPPAKGPTTFEQMGVPATKQDNECIVM